MSDVFAPTEAMVMHLYHGRETASQDMDGEWGSEGPALGIEFVSITYGASVMIHFTGLEYPLPMERFMVGDCFYYNGIYYGDVSFERNTDPDREVELMHISKTVFNEGE